MSFTGFPDEGLVFYEGLEADNSKAYWTEHKALYEDKILRPMTELEFEKSCRGPLAPGPGHSPRRTDARTTQTRQRAGRKEQNVRTSAATRREIRFLPPALRRPSSQPANPRRGGGSAPHGPRGRARPTTG